MNYKLLKISAKLLALSLFFFWAFEHPGSVNVVWHGYELKTSVNFFLFFILTALFFLGELLRSSWTKIRWLFTGGGFSKKPDVNALVAQAFLDLEFSNHSHVKQIADKLQAHLPESPLAGILMLKLSQALSHESYREEAFKILGRFKEFEPFLLDQEINQALSDNDFSHAQKLLEKAGESFQEAGWFVKAQIRFLCLGHSWEEALSFLEKAAPKEIYPKKTLAHLKALCFFNLSQKTGLNWEGQIELLEKAYAEDPLFVLNTLALAQVLAKKKDMRAAEVILKSLWQEAPSWKIATFYCDLLSSQGNIIEKIHRMRELYDLIPQNPVALLALSIYLIQGKLWVEARKLLKSLPQNKPEPLILKAALEQKEKGNSQACLTLLLDAIQMMSTSYKCSNCQKSLREWTLYCPACNEFDTLFLKYPISYKDCLLALHP